jgi:hypothetical protein
MPALPVVPNVLKIVYSGTIGAHNWACINHCAWSGTTPTAAALNALATDLEAPWSADLKAYWHTSTILEEIQLTDLTTLSGAVGSATPAMAGTSAGVEIGGNASVLVDFPSSYRYRGGHPRMYLPPFVQSQLASSSAWASGAISQAGTFMAALQALYNSSTSGGTTLAGQCAVSYVNKALNPTPPYRRTTPLVMPIPTDTFTVQAEIASQRRRIGRK